MTVNRENWIHSVDDVIRSRHYTWIPEGLGGEPIDVAMTWVLTDVMHICQRANLGFDELLQKAMAQFREEERERENQARS